MQMGQRQSPNKLVHTHTSALTAQVFAVREECRKGQEEQDQEASWGQCIPKCGVEKGARGWVQKVLRNMVHTHLEHRACGMLIGLMGLQTGRRPD